MKKFIAFTALALTVVSTAYAAADQSTDKQASMMQGDMMENCQHHMKDGKMMDTMPKDMMGQCQKMMKDGGMMKGGMMQGGMKDVKPADAAKTETPKTDAVDHKAHHPAQ